jgi:hypothetical protein
MRIKTKKPAVVSDVIENHKRKQQQEKEISKKEVAAGVLEQSTIRTSGPGSVVGIATGYGLDGPGIEYRWRRDFPHLSRPALGSTHSPVQWVPSLSRG